jgi:hypothetical protein
MVEVYPRNLTELEANFRTEEERGIPGPVTMAGWLPMPRVGTGADRGRSEECFWSARAVAAKLRHLLTCARPRRCLRGG